MNNKINPNVIFLCIASILVFLLVVATSTSKEDKNEGEENKTSVIVPTTPSTVSPTAGTTTNTNTNTLSVVATHKDPNNCWLVISGKVYNVTSFINSHPGGKSQITSRCGTDVTTAFNGGVYKHSSYAKGLLPTYFVGDLSL